MVIAPFMLKGHINEAICNELIDYFEASPLKVPGYIVNNGEIEQDKTVKESDDLCIAINSPMEDAVINYLKALQLVVDLYKETYVWSDKNQAPWGITDGFNIQRYKPKQAYKAWHFERSAPTCKRHLVFMTYLNTIKDGGQTEWLYQKLKVKPQKGVTLIWPADWTFTHRGLPSMSETKYIATGWFSFI